MNREVIVVGFPKCGTTALMRAFDRDDDFHVLRTEQKGLEITWPSIKTNETPTKVGKIRAHKFTAYAYNTEALTYFAENNRDSLIVVCVRDPNKALISWHNMHRRIAREGKHQDHFAWKEREFYANCDLSQYYERFAGERLAYDHHIKAMLEIVPRNRLFVTSQESLAQHMNLIVEDIKARASGQKSLVDYAQALAATSHQAYADSVETSAPIKIQKSLNAIDARVHELIKNERLANSMG